MYIYFYRGPYKKQLPSNLGNKSTKIPQNTLHWIKLKSKVKKKQ